MLGRKGHAGSSNRYEWRAHRNEDGDIRLPCDGGVLEQQVPQPKPKNPARADGLFGVCATIPMGGRRLEGRRMTPLRYRGRVVGIAAYERALAAEIARVRQLGRENRDKMADPNVRSTKGVWHNHADAENPYEVSKSETRVPFFFWLVHSCS